MMGKMGFGRKWNNWMNICVRSISFLILVNVSSKGYFSSSRGLRQGDPFSPYLFIMITEAFYRMIQRASGGFIWALWLGGRVCPFTISILHMAR